MPNLIKYSTSAVTYTIKKGNIVLGVNNVDYGPTSTSGFYNGITPPISGYTFYINKPSGGPSIYVSTGDTQTIQLIQSLGGTGSTIENTLSWVASQSDIVVANRDYENIVTSGMVLNLDAGFTGSYPKGNQQWYDISGSGNTGTLTNGPTFNSFSGGSIVFDGTNDYVDLGNPNLYKFTTNFSISAWALYSQIKTQWPAIIAKGDQAYRISANETGTKFHFGINNSTTTSIFFDSTINFELNKWYYITLTFTNIKLTGYVNGVESGNVSFASPTSCYNNPYNVRLGSNEQGSGGRHWPGRISGVQFYNRVLSAQEVLQNYQSTFTRFLGENIVGNGLALYLDASYLPSYSGSGTNWYDISGNNNNGTLTNGPTFSGGSIVFDGSNDYIDLGNVEIVPSSANTITLESWVNITSFQSYRGIISRTRAADPYGGYQLNLNNEGSVNKFDFALNINGVWRTWVNSGGSFGRSLSANTWYHVVGLYDGTGLSMYLNGTLVSKQNITGAFQYASGISNTSIGRNVGGDTYMNGQINNVKIYNRNLSPFEVYQNYNAQKSRFGIPDIVTNGLVLNLDAGNPNSYNPLNTGSTTWTDTTNTTTGGTLVNGTYYSGGTMVFDGTDDYVNLPHIFDISSGGVTWNIWFKASSTSWSPLFSDWYNNQWSFNIQVYLGYITVNIRNASNVDLSPTFQLYAVSSNTIYNLICTYDKTTKNTILYINGTLINSYPNSLSDSAIRNTTNNWSIGYKQDSGNILSGNVYTAQIYNRALTQAEITQNFNALKNRYGL